MSDKQFYILLGGGTLLALYLLYKGKEAAGKVAAGINPTSRDNWFYTAANDLADILMDGQNDDDQVLLDLFDWEMWGRD